MIDWIIGEINMNNIFGNPRRHLTKTWNEKLFKEGFLLIIQGVKDCDEHGLQVE